MVSDFGSCDILSLLQWRGGRCRCAMSGTAHSGWTHESVLDLNALKMLRGSGDVRIFRRSVSSDGKIEYRGRKFYNTAT